MKNIPCTTSITLQKQENQKIRFNSIGYDNYATLGLVRVTARLLLPADFNKSDSKCLHLFPASLIMTLALFLARCSRWATGVTILLDRKHGLDSSMRAMRAMHSHAKMSMGRSTALNAVFALHSGHLNHLGHPLVTAYSATRHEQQIL